jgi:hypothetical protein
MEDDGADAVKVATKGVDLPCIGLGVAPDFDLAIVTTASNERRRWVEGGVVDTAVVALENPLDNCV